jgi:transcriptional regulator NrdR family protein
MFPCPKCKSKTDVIDSRINPEKKIRRRRKCEKCGYRFSTVESIKIRAKKPEIPKKEEKKDLKKQETKELTEKIEDEGWDDGEEWV